jgi:6-pyruvoyl-tetrahydropterin synthase
MSNRVGIVECVPMHRHLYRVRVYVSDDADETECVYFDTPQAAERFISRLPEATR